VLDLAVEIESLAREMATSIQQYQIVELGSPQSSRRLEAIGRINANAVTPEDISARVAGRLVGIDEEKLLAIENGAATKWWWLVHPLHPKPKRICGKRGRILLPGGRKVNRNMKSPDGHSGLPYFYDLGPHAAAARIGLARRRILHRRLAPLPFTGRGWKLRSSSQRIGRLVPR
jgi:hypothetical protein